ncbi:hypothetical protein M422DRAFT_248985 [Sphaerobolus stellatus SS14]|nr:hypothetical protein M422DRAFT_248985 [Sphaerobolus stellatus SS14]
MSHKRGLTAGDLTDPPSTSVDPQQSPEVLAPEHPDKPSAQAYGAQTVPSRVQSPLRVAGPSNTATQGLSPSRLAGASGTAHWGSDSPSSESWQNLGDALSNPDHVSPDAGDTDEEENFTIPASEVSILHQEYTDFVNLKDNAEIVLSEAMEATEWLNIPSKKVSGKTREPGNNWAHDKAAAKAAAEQIVVQTATMEPVPESGTDD